MSRFFIKLIFFATLFSGSFAMEEKLKHYSFQEQDAVRVIQHAFRSYHFKQNKQKILDDMYEKGVLYKNGKVQGFEKGSFYALARAGAHFFLPAREGNVKAQHNLAVVYYTSRNYNKAYFWFQKASLQNFPPSTRNLKIVSQEIERIRLEVLSPLSKEEFVQRRDYLSTMPKAIFCKISSHAVEKSLPTFSTIMRLNKNIYHFAKSPKYLSSILKLHLEFRKKIWRQSVPPEFHDILLDKDNNFTSLLKTSLNVDQSELSFGGASLYFWKKVIFVLKNIEKKPKGDIFDLLRLDPLRSAEGIRTLILDQDTNPQGHRRDITYSSIFCGELNYFSNVSGNKAPAYKTIGKVAK